MIDQQLMEYFVKLEEQFGFNVCGEGGEYETLVMDCPLFVDKYIKVD